LLSIGSSVDQESGELPGPSAPPDPKAGVLLLDELELLALDEPPPPDVGAGVVLGDVSTGVVCTGSLSVGDGVEAVVSV
jgi:hypothetical protein